MERLRPGWFLQGLWDAEYQQYRLLAYLARVRREYLAQRLYPHLADLIASYEEMRQLARQVEETNPTPELETLQEILTFSLPRVESSIEEGRLLYETIANSLYVQVVGVVPMYRDEGYVLLRRGTEREVHVYLYELRRVYDAQGQQVAIRLTFVGTYAQVGFLSVREKLLTERKDLPVPLTLGVESLWKLPIEPTLLPIIQRSLPKWTQAATEGGLG